MIIIGCPKEIKLGETRVGITPSNVEELLKRHKVQVFVESKGGLASGFYDEEYINAGAIIKTQQEIWEESDIIVKVKEPVDSEYKFINSQIIFGYFHLNSSFNAPLVEKLKTTSALCIPYENITKGNARPCLAPMSAIAGRLAVQKGAQYLENKGILLGGIPGVPKAKVTILGCGVSGFNALQIAYGMQADVTVLDIDTDKLSSIEQSFPGVKTLFSNESNIFDTVIESDLVIGTVLVPNSSAPKLITVEMINQMRVNSVIVDVCIDEGGCTELSHPTTHQDPIYTTHDNYKYRNHVQFYCVANMPALVPKNSTQALTNATMPYLDKIIKYAGFYKSSDTEVYHSFLSKELQLYNIDVIDSEKLKVFFK